MAFNPSTKKVWFTTSGTIWTGSGDPAAGTGGLDCSALNAGPYFPAVTLFDSGDSVTLNAGGSAFTYTAPSGASNW
jgi:hypothetical protein